MACSGSLLYIDAKLVWIHHRYIIKAVSLNKALFIDMLLNHEVIRAIQDVIPSAAFSAIPFLQHISIRGTHPQSPSRSIKTSTRRYAACVRYGMISCGHGPLKIKVGPRFLVSLSFMLEPQLQV